MDGYGALDRCMSAKEGSAEDGSAALHIACIHGFLDTFYYILLMLIVWDKIQKRKIERGDTSFSKFKTLRETLKYGNKQDMTPLLLAAKFDNYEIFRVLF